MNAVVSAESAETYGPWPMTFEEHERRHEFELKETGGSRRRYVLNESSNPHDLYCLCCHQRVQRPTTD